MHVLRDRDFERGQDPWVALGPNKSYSKTQVCDYVRDGSLSALLASVTTKQKAQLATIIAALATTIAALAATAAAACKVILGNFHLQNGGSSEVPKSNRQVTTRSGHQEWQLADPEVLAAHKGCKVILGNFHLQNGGSSEVPKSNRQVTMHVGKRGGFAWGAGAWRSVGRTSQIADRKIRLRSARPHHDSTTACSELKTDNSNSPKGSSRITSILGAPAKSDTKRWSKGSHWCKSACVKVQQGCTDVSFRGPVV